MHLSSKLWEHPDNTLLTKCETIRSRTPGSNLKIAPTPEKYFSRTITNIYQVFGKMAFICKEDKASST